MSQASNYAAFNNSANPRLSHPIMALYGPSTAANLGSGVFDVTDGSTGDIVFIIKGLTSETIGVTISTDGTNYSSALIVVDNTTGLDTANATLGNGTYILPLKRFGSPRYVKFTKSATTESAAVAVSTSYLVPGFVGV